jgi:hypothetical protein
MKKSIAAMIFCAALPICVENSRGMVPGEEGFSFFAPIEKFVDLACDREYGISLAQTWIAFVAELKSMKHGGQGCIDEKSAHRFGMHSSFKDYFRNFKLDCSYDHPSIAQEDEVRSRCPDMKVFEGSRIDPALFFYTSVSHEADGILSKYPAFAEAFGNTDDPSRPECYYVAAKNDGESSDYRRREDMLNGLGEDFTLDCDGGVGNTRKVNAFLQLLLLTEIAEWGQANETVLDRLQLYKQKRIAEFKSFGYNPAIISKFYKLVNIIME